MFALLMCDDRISMQPRRREIIQGLKVLPGKSGHQPASSATKALIANEIRIYMKMEEKKISTPVWF